MGLNSAFKGLKTKSQFTKISRRRLWYHDSLRQTQQTDVM